MTGTLRVTIPLVAISHGQGEISGSSLDLAGTLVNLGVPTGTL